MSQDLREKASLKFCLFEAQSIFLVGTISVLRSDYPDAEIHTAQTAIDALNQVANLQPNLVVVDISIPEKPGEMARINTGIQLLRTLMKSYPNLNLVVQSTQLRTLVRMKAEIAVHKGGFTVADKSISAKELLKKINWALQGLTHTKDLKGVYSLEKVNPEWLRFLSLAFQEGLQDKAIAHRICVSERMVRYYWYRLHVALDIDCEELKKQNKNIRVVTQIRAREAGLID